MNWMTAGERVTEPENVLRVTRARFVRRFGLWRAAAKTTERA